MGRRARDSLRYKAAGHRAEKEWAKAPAGFALLSRPPAQWVGRPSLVQTPTRLQFAFGRFAMHKNLNAGGAEVT